MTIPGGVPCRNPNCEREVLGHWWFCPHCGQDNRTVRGLAVDQETCDHQFVIEGPCCIVCGYDPERGTPSELRIARLGQGLLLGVSLVPIFAFGYLLTRGPVSSGDRSGRMYGILLAASVLWFGRALWKFVDLYRRPPTV